MRKIILLCLLLSAYVPTIAQTAQSPQQVFASKEADDYAFVIYGNLLDNDYVARYYIEDDTLHVTLWCPMYASLNIHYRVALNLIDFSKSTAATDAKWMNQDNKTKAAHLKLQVKAGKTFSSDLNDKFAVFKSVISEVTMVFPDVTTANAALAYLKNPAPAAPPPVTTVTGPVKTAAPKQVPAQELCNAVLTFLNEMSQNGFETYVGSLASSETSYGLAFRKYNSTVSFPQGITTLISDTNRLTRFRTAEIQMLEEDASGTSISTQMKNYYTQINAIFKVCLEPQKFTITNPATDMLREHVMSASYRFVNPSDDDDNPFASMRMYNGLVVEVYINQRTAGGSTKNMLFVRFKRG